MIGTLIFLVIITVIVNYIPMPGTLKNIIYIVLEIVALLAVLPLVGINVPLR